MGKDFYCPVCGAFQEHVNLEETDNTFICDKCKSVVHFDKISDDRSKIEFTKLSAHCRAEVLLSGVSAIRDIWIP